jgi:quinol monooxygenase YgiN
LNEHSREEEDDCRKESKGGKASCPIPRIFYFIYFLQTGCLLIFNLSSKTLLMDKLQIAARFQVHYGQLAPFKQVAGECLSVVKTKELDSIQYEWFFNPAQTECVVRETYRDSNALLDHLGNLGDLFAKLLAISDFSVEVYGQPSEELLTATSGLDMKLYRFYQGV